MVKEDCCKRDILAVERTHLANERTLLSYWRTSFSFIALGAFIIRFVEDSSRTVLSIFSFIVGIAFFIYGIKRFKDYKKKINHI